MVCGGADAFFQRVPAAHAAITHGGLQRHWYTYVPSAAASAPVPLVVDLHGARSCAEELGHYSGWLAVAKAHGLAIAWPQGIDAADDRSWNAGWCCHEQGRHHGDAGRLQGVQERLCGFACNAWAEVAS